ncbi:MAG: replication-associated recombination protein A [bacterium]
MADLFEEEKNNLEKITPLALRMSPKNLEGFIGQNHILGQGKILRRLIEADRIVSIILAGPPGSGKTALAKLIANTTKSHFISLNAVTAKVDDLRRVIEEARYQIKAKGKKTIVLVDEIHRFSKVQQEALLPSVEDGTIILIGLTTENPNFAIANALTSRAQVFILNKLQNNDIRVILKNAIEDKERGLGKLRIKMAPQAVEHLVEMSDGDARKALSALELGVLTTEPDKNGIINFSLQTAEESIQRKRVLYDRDGDEHYNTISAFIKSMRGSDPDAVVYWLAKMLFAGEDPRFIARRIVICAAEDVGDADPMALVIANAAYQACELIGMPEARIPLSEAAIYIACAPKSNACYTAIEKAMDDVRKERIQDVPIHLQDKHSSGPGAGEGYKYPHNYKDANVEQRYLDKKKKYYEKKNNIKGVD